MTNKDATLALEQKVKLANEIHAKNLATVRKYSSERDLPEIVQDQIAAIPDNTAKKRVLILYYGGTLGMTYEERHGSRVLVPTDDTKKLLLPIQNKRFEDCKTLEEKMHLVWLSALDKPIDSTNARFPHWLSMANIITLLYDEFDGFVIAGGTDTHNYLLAAMALIFRNIGKPIIGTGAQLPIEHWGEDASNNLSFALSAALSDLSGVYSAFYNDLRDGRRIFKVKDKDPDAFASPDAYKVGRFTSSQLNLFGNYLKRDYSINGDNLTVERDFRDGIHEMEISPFTDPRVMLSIAKDERTHAILLKTYGAGNVRDLKLHELDESYVTVLKELHEQGFPVILGSPMQDGVVDSPYDTGDKAMEAGAISGGNTTGAMLMAKISRCLALAWNQEIGLDYLKFRSLMYTNHVGEFDENIRDRMKKR